LLHNQAVPDEERGGSVTFAPVRLHMISALEGLKELSISSKFNSEPMFLEMLHERGVAAAEAWLAAHFDDVGQRATLEPALVFRP
jgi:NTE family protein